METELITINFDFYEGGELKYSILLLIFKKNDTQKFGVKIKFESINNKQKKVAASDCG